MLTYQELATRSILDADHQELDVRLGHDGAIGGSDRAIGGLVGRSHAVEELLVCEIYELLRSANSSSFEDTEFRRSKGRNLLSDVIVTRDCGSVAGV